MDWIVLAAALAMDALLGDPRWLPHPVRWMGAAIDRCEPLFRRMFSSQTLAGGAMALALILGAWAGSRLLLEVCFRVNDLLGIGMEIVMVFYCLSARSLAEAAAEIDMLLKSGRTETARRRLSLIVGRDVSQYGPDEIGRAVVETVAENFGDGVVAPLFYAVLGGGPLAIAYKMVNTLDSMIGYKNDRYVRFGKTAARLDDAANFIPARLCVPLIAAAVWLLGSRNGRRSLATAWKEGRRHASPNAGCPEAAFSGALGVRLGGPNVYHGRIVAKPFIGSGFPDASAKHIRAAWMLMAVSAVIAAVFACLLSRQIHP